MIREMVLPQLAMGMSEGTVVEWYVRDGGRAERDAPLLVIETEKVSTELPAPYTGFVKIVVPAGETVPVEVVIARIADTEEEYRSLAAGEPAAPNVVVETAVAVAAPSAAVAGGRIRASGLARKLAGLNGLDLSGLAGTGPGGRIVKRDVLAALDRAGAAPVAIPMPQAGFGPREKARIPLTGMRKAIADRMVNAKVSAAHTYTFFEIDVTKLEAARAVMLAREEELGGRISTTALYARALAMACQTVPICNSTLLGNEVVVWENVNIGFAVALPGKSEFDSGLVVPVIKNAETKGVLAIDREMKALAARARAKQLTADDMADGTVSLSSTAGFLPGTWSVSAPILNLPQTVIFQPGSPVRKPVAVDDQVAIRTILPCGLTFDHRAMDGEPVSRLLRRIVDLLSNPELMTL